ncbi:serine/threonine-protein kinase PRP4 homolog [Phalaenopsis equestris]|uniref:serine/threonine-protein kinase PRP4 homolog n=1 Tax=Phalaenopsis equestris TaxID=78828 RepID=UPI0009E30E18|nr:serine/threonine-protein kinase PRP4 homolog [Phalaenopsis equestris]
MYAVDLISLLSLSFSFKRFPPSSFFPYFPFLCWIRMDTNSPLETTVGFNEEDVDSLADKVDLNRFKSKETPHDEMKVFSNEEEAQDTSVAVEFNLAGSSLQVNELEEAESKTSDYVIERVGSPDEPDDKYENDMDADTDIKVIVEDDGLNHKFKSSSDQGDNDREYYKKPSTSVSVTNGNYDQLSVDPQTEEVEVNKEMDDRNLNLNSELQNQIEVRDYSPKMATPENERMVWANSSLQSTQETRNVSPSPKRRLSISAERSSHSQSPPNGHASARLDMSSPRLDMSSPSKFDVKSAPSPQSSKRRRSPSPEKRSMGNKRASSRDCSSPSKRPKSPSERASRREPQNKVNSPRRHLSRSPRKHDSPRRRGRSTSKSPLRRRGSPRLQRDRRGSRSRSPNARYRSIRSPRRLSPRRRSPPTYHPRQRSSRRPWSPPPNRNTGIGRPGKNLFIAGFSYVTTERDLEKKFSKFGRVTDVRVVRDRRTGDSRGFGFLSLERDEDADAAIRAVDQTEWNGRIVLVEKSKTSTR